MPIVIYHNPRCSKSRQTLQLLETEGHSPEVVEYLKTPPDAATLARLVKLLDVEPTDIMRTSEDDFRENKAAIRAMPPSDQIDWLARHPKVLQRPIVVNGDRARIGRPPENVLDLLS